MSFRIRSLEVEIDRLGLFIRSGNRELWIQWRGLCAPQAGQRDPWAETYKTSDGRVTRVGRVEMTYSSRTAKQQEQGATSCQ